MIKWLIDGEELEETEGIRSAVLKMGATINVSFGGKNKRSASTVGGVLPHKWGDNGGVRSTPHSSSKVASSTRRKPGGGGRNEAGTPSFSAIFSNERSYRRAPSSVGGFRSFSSSMAVASPLKSVVVREAALFTRRSLTIYNISRQLLMARIQCSARNSRTLPPATSSATVDMNCEY